MFASVCYLKLPVCILAIFLVSGFSYANAQDPPDEAPSGVTIERDLDFLEPGREEKLDLYRPTGSGAEDQLPAVVVIHGGGWAKGDKNRMREYVSGTSLAKAGYVAISINYETAKGKRWPNNLHDCKNAVRWLRKNAETLGVDPDRIGVIGGSAGGHLALMVAYTGDNPDLSPALPYPDISDKVSACVNMYGITNLWTRKVAEKDGTPTAEPKSHRLFAETREENPELWKIASPTNYVSKDVPPTLTFHGTKDKTVDRDQAKELDAKLREAGADSTLRMIKNAGHAWPLKTSDFDLTGEMVAFFDKHLKGDVSQGVKRDESKISKPKSGIKDQTQPKAATESSSLNRPNVLFIAVDNLND